MFEANKKIYMTRAVANEISQKHQQFILGYIHENQGKLTDYMQVFDFYVEGNQQWLIQRQGQPERETTIFVQLDNSLPVNRKVWVMDQGDHVILLFPEDY
jgi:protein-tyrosine phosphatase